MSEFGLDKLLKDNPMYREAYLTLEKVAKTPMGSVFFQLTLTEREEVGEMAKILGRQIDELNWKEEKGFKLILNALQIMEQACINLMNDEETEKMV